MRPIPEFEPVTIEMRCIFLLSILLYRLGARFCKKSGAVAFRTWFFPPSGHCKS